MNGIAKELPVDERIFDILSGYSPEEKRKILENVRDMIIREYENRILETKDTYYLAKQYLDIFMDVPLIQEHNSVEASMIEKKPSGYPYIQ